MYLSSWAQTSNCEFSSLRIVEGTLVIVVSFIFIVQSASAIDLWLNFAAVQFVGLLDDTAFLLSRNRFLGSVAKHLANRVIEFEVHSERVKSKKRMRRLRLALFIGIGIFMWAGLSFFVYNQANSTYACRTVIVTVGKVRHQNGRHFSGRYNIQDYKINNRAFYLQEQGRGAFLAYCGENGINRWTLSPLNSNESPQDPCNKIWLVCLVCILFALSRRGILDLISVFFHSNLNVQKHTMSLRSATA